MINDWRNWEFKNINKIKNKSFGKKFKLIFFFFIITICLISNLKLIEVLSLADGKIIPQGRIKFVQHLEGGIVERNLNKKKERKLKLINPWLFFQKKKASSEFEEINARIKSINLSILRVNSEKKQLNKLIIPKEMKNKFDQELIKFEEELLKK